MNIYIDIENTNVYAECLGTKKNKTHEVASNGLLGAKQRAIATPSPIPTCAKLMLRPGIGKQI